MTAWWPGSSILPPSCAAKLARAGRGCRRLALWVARADGSSTVIEAGLSAPSREPRHLLRLVEDKIEALDMGFGVDLMALDRARHRAASPGASKSHRG